MLLSNYFDGNNRILRIRIILPNISNLKLNMNTYFFMCFFIVTGAVVFDLRTERIPNWYLTCSSLVLLTAQFVIESSINWKNLLITPVLVLVILFPLFIIGAIGAGDIKLLCTLALVYTFKDLLIIFFFSLICGAVIGLIKVCIYRNLGERFKYMFAYINQLNISLWMQGAKGLEKSYIDGLDKNMVKKAGIHYSLPILVGLIIYVGVKK